VAAGLTMPQGTPVNVTDQIIARIEESAIQLQKELREEAIKTFREGIAVASKKGDLMPLKEMQQKLNQLLDSVL